MSRVGLKSVVFQGESCLGEAEIFPTKDPKFPFPNNEIRITHFSPASERCPPLSILQTISPFSIPCKLESKSPALNCLHSSCSEELKTAVVLLGEEEVHLVAMQAKQEKLCCFWCCSVPAGLYNSCLGMLNLRCLAIVFDLDETLIVANTMKSFEDRIEFLQRKIGCETDVLRAGGMKAELKRYMDDRALLKQYSESDQVLDNGKVLKTLPEEVPQVSSNQDAVVFRPIIRLNDKNIVLTRINPEVYFNKIKELCEACKVRDTSVLVRLRPAWEDLRSYLTAKGRKRFEVYVCTMAERDYALEMWRLLDPEAHLISSKQLLDRVVCVKSGSRKSLPNVFHGVICHPRMAMVIDDRLKVWDDKDQLRVHVVPAFTPYYAPQAEMATAVPVLCVARNVACNVRGGFFKQFDEHILRRISEIYYEDEIANLPSPPDVSDYLMLEDTVPNGNIDLPVPEGVSGADVECRLNRLDQKLGAESGSSFVTNNPDLRPEPSHQPVAISSSAVTPPMSRPTMPSQKPGLLGASPRQVGPTQPDMNLDMRRKLLMLQNGQGLRDQSSVGPLISRPPAQVLAPAIQSNGGWFVVDEVSSGGQFNRRPSGVTRESDFVQPDKYRALRNPHNQSSDTSTVSEKPCNVSQEKVEEAYPGDGKRRQNIVNPAQSSPGVCDSEDDGMSLNRVPSNNGDSHLEAGTVAPQLSTLSIGVLQEIGRRCGSKVEFRSVVGSAKDLQFSVEVIFTGEKIGAGMGKTKKEARLQAAENALRNLANKYVAYTAPDSGTIDSNIDKPSVQSENGFLMDIDSSTGLAECKEAFPNSTNAEKSGALEESKRLSVVVSGIRELCMGEDLNIVFQDTPPASMTLSKGEYYSQVQVAGQVRGKGTSVSKEGAKLQAAEEALESLKSMLNQQGQKRTNSPRALESVLAKRSKDEIQQGLQNLPSSA